MKRSISSSTTFIVHQSVMKHNQLCQYEIIKSSNFDLSLSQVLHPCLSGVSIIIQIFDSNQINKVNIYIKNNIKINFYDILESNKIQFRVLNEFINSPSYVEYQKKYFKEKYYTELLNDFSSPVLLCAFAGACR